MSEVAYSGTFLNLEHFKNIVVQASSLQDIQDVIENLKFGVEDEMLVGASRSFGGNYNAFWQVYERMVGNEPKAKPILRKLFTVSGHCNLEEEIWIEDKQNPDAGKDPMKAYTVVHVHYHGHVPRELVLNNPWSLNPVYIDAINARHITPAKGNTPKHFQDNPFFGTAIEPSGKRTLKLFPHGYWACDCGQKENSWDSLKCSKCWQNTRRCVAWNWQEDQVSDLRLANILGMAKQSAELWKSGGMKDRPRCVRTQDCESVVDGQSTWTLLEVMSHVTATKPPRVCGLFIGINEYIDSVGTLKTAVTDARLLWQKTKEISTREGEVLAMPPEFGERLIRDDFMQYAEEFGESISKAKEEVQIVLFYFAGHGRMSSSGEYMLTSNFKPTGDEMEYMSRRRGCVHVRELIDLICNKAGEKPAKIFLFDMCRDGKAAPSALEYTNLPTNTLLVFSTQLGCRTWELEDKSPFCMALEKYMFRPDEKLELLIKQSSDVAEDTGKANPDFKGKIRQECLQILNMAKQEAVTELQSIQPEERSQQMLKNTLQEILAIDINSVCGINPRGHEGSMRLDSTCMHMYSTPQQQSPATSSAEDVLNSQFESDGGKESICLSSYDDVLSQIDTPVASSDEESDSFDIIECPSPCFGYAHNENDLKKALEMLEQFEAAMAMASDQLSTELYREADKKALCESQNYTKAAMTEHTRTLLSSDGYFAGNGMVQMFFPNTFERLTNAEREPILEQAKKQIQRIVAFTKNLLESARQRFCAFVGCVDTGSFVAQLKMTSFTAAILSVLLRRFVDFRKIVRGLGFTSFILPGHCTKELQCIVLQGDGSAFRYKTIKVAQLLKEYSGIDRSATESEQALVSQNKERVHAGELWESPHVSDLSKRVHNFLL
jgi:hypothetical protein